MAKVSVSEESITSLITILQEARTGLEDSVIHLKMIYSRASNEWNDKQYRQLGDIMERASKSILIIASELGSAKEKLKKLRQNIQDYMGTEVMNNSKSEHVYERNIDGLGWRTIDEEHDIATDLQNVNPNWLQSEEWQINCQRCVPTYEMRRRGYDVTSLPKPNNVSTSDLCYHPFAVWENPTIISTSGNGQEDIENQMAQWGDGARAQVTVIWNNGESGHTFIAEQENGRTRFIDPQSGSENSSWYFSRVQEGSTRFCRIDNLNVTNRINDCCREVQI